ncbi:MAG TPA: hypothetical protein VGL35_04360 [Rhizomicrobium sp.]|jgi:hypothetical protein
MSGPQKPQAPTALPIPAKVRRESGDVHARSVFAIVFGWFVFVFIGLAFLMYVYETAAPFPKPPLDSSYPAPRLITHPFALEPPYLAAQERALATGALPITRAMAKIAARPDPYAPITAEDVHGR